MSGSAPRTPARTLLVHDWLTGMRGGEQVLEQLLEVYPEAPIATLFHFPGSVSETIESRPIFRSAIQRLPGLEKHYRYYLPLFPWAVGRFDTSDYDLVISVSHSVASGVRTPADTYHLCYCNSPMRYVWDQRRVYFPNSSGFRGRAREAILDRLQAWDVATAGRVDMYLANSCFVAKRIAHAYGVDSEVVHPPVHSQDLRSLEQALDRGYLVAVAALVPYKRLDLAIDIAEAAGRPLRIIGDGPERQRLEQQAAQSSAPVHFEGRVPRNRLVELLRHASAFLQPGIEDFGISSVEALAAGTPVVAFGEGGVCDIVRPDVDGVLVDSQDLSAWVAAIDSALQMRSNYLDRMARVEQFSPARFRARIEDILRRRPTSSRLRECNRLDPAKT